MAEIMPVDMRPSGALTMAEALVALLCHDFSSPLGTLISALELAEEDPEAEQEALLLAREAASRMAKRLRLLRAAWGGECGAMPRKALQDLLGGLPSRISVDMSGLHGHEFTGAVVRVLLGAVLLGAESLPRGGVVMLMGTADESMTIVPKGISAAWPARLLAELLAPGSTSLEDPHAVHGTVLGYLAQAAGLRAGLLGQAGAMPEGCPPLLLERLT